MNKCPLCDSDLVPGKSVNKHHLIPKLKGGTEAEEVHKICHGKLHSIWSENELRDTYNNWGTIKKDDRIIKFITWVRKRFEMDPEFIDSNKLSNNHKKRRRK